MKYCPFLSYWQIIQLKKVVFLWLLRSLVREGLWRWTWGTPEVGAIFSSLASKWAEIRHLSEVKLRQGLLRPVTKQPMVRTIHHPSVRSTGRTLTQVVCGIKFSTDSLEIVIPYINWWTLNPLYDIWFFSFRTKYLAGLRGKILKREVLWDLLNCNFVSTEHYLRIIDGRTGTWEWRTHQ